MHQFNDRVLLLTGAAGGIGRATARCFLDGGARVVLADYAEAALSDLARALDPSGTRVAALRYDAANPQDAERAVALCIECFGRLDYAVPGAGIYETMPLSEMTDDQWRRTMSVNLDGVFYLCSRAARRIAPGGAIVGVASGAAHSGASANHSAYGASKGGVLAFLRTLAKELAPAIRVNAVSPGIVDTEMGARAVGNRRDELVQGNPMKRLAVPDDIAGAIAFLCSDQAAHINGETIMINGGAYIA